MFCIVEQEKLETFSTKADEKQDKYNIRVFLELFHLKKL